MQPPSFKILGTSFEILFESNGKLSCPLIHNSKSRAAFHNQGQQNHTQGPNTTEIQYGYQKLIHLKENTSSRHTSSHNRALRSNTSAVATGPFKVKIPVAHGA